MANSAAEVKKRIDKIRAAAVKAQEKAVMLAAAEMRKSVELSRDTVAHGGRLRNARGVLVVGTTVTSGAKPSATVFPIGPWQLIENDTKPHMIGGGAKRSSSGAKRLTLPNGGIRGSVRHPGTKGKHPFRKGLELGGPKVVETMHKTTVAAVKEAAI